VERYLRSANCDGAFDPDTVRVLSAAFDHAAMMGAGFFSSLDSAIDDFRFRHRMSNRSAAVREPLRRLSTSRYHGRLNQNEASVRANALYFSACSGLSEAFANA
jgi:hypothetical protein